ncbi:MAG TPA: hypothetical protein VFS61_07085 [Anaerolineales bacterium]|nr:hypothetical protein [Anaerolineales bacterium]
MKHIHLFFLMFVVAAALGLSACGPKPATTEKINPSTLKDIEGSDLKQVILTGKAAERIGLETVPASEMVVPYAAVIYDIEGNTWVYSNPEPLTFVRVPIVIDRIEGDQAFLLEGLQTDAPIVTVGVAEIYGAETGVSK